MKRPRHGTALQQRLTIALLVESELSQFMVIRTILKSPTWHKQTIEKAKQSNGGDRLRFVDPYSFFLLLKSRHAARSRDG